MIKFINSELFKTKTEERDMNGEQIFSTAVYSTVLTKGLKPNQKTNRLVGVVTSDVEDFTLNKGDIRIFKTGEEPNVKKMIKISSSEKNKHDLPVYFIAIPFNGFLEPIKEDFGYRIYRGFIVKSEHRDIEFNGSYYKKVLYLVMVPNELMFKEDHKYHRDFIELSVTSYYIEDDKDDPKEKHTYREVHTITFKKGEYGCKIENEETSPINTDDFKDKNIIPIFELSEKKVEESSASSKKPFKSEKEKKKFSKPTTGNIGNVTKDADTASEHPRKTLPKVTEEVDDVRTEPLNNKPFQDIDKMIEEFNRKNKSENFSHKQKGSKKKKRKK